MTDQLFQRPELPGPSSPHGGGGGAAGGAAPSQAGPGKLLLAFVLGGATAGIIAIIFLVATVAYDSSRGGDLGKKQLKVDGKSNLPGGLASVSVDAGDYRFEFTERQGGSGWDAGPAWKIGRWTRWGRSFVELKHARLSPAIDSPSILKEFLTFKNGQNEEIAGHDVTYQTKQIAGRTAYVWQYTDEHNDWYFTAWIPGPTDSFRFSCRALRDDRSNFRRRCRSALNSLQIFTRR